MTTGDQANAKLEPSRPSEHHLVRQAHRTPYEQGNRVSQRKEVQPGFRETPIATATYIQRAFNYPAVSCYSGNPLALGNAGLFF